MLMTEHARIRMSQRAIKADDINIALVYGEKKRSHGRYQYILTDRAIARSPFIRRVDRLRGLCVIVDTSSCIITVKWLFDVRHHPGILRKQRLVA